MPANTYGRQVIIPLTNKSGGGVVAGDVVVIDTGNNDAFTTTTSAGFTGGIGVAQETIASNAVGRVLVSGYAALVNVNASVTRGNFGATHTVAKQAAGTGSRGAGTFCQFLTGGTTPDALVYPADLAAAALTDPMTTRGDIIVRNASNVTARLGRGSAATVLTSDGTDVAWAAPASSGALVLLEQHTASSSASLAFTTAISSTYDEYLIELVGLQPATNNVDIYMRMSTNGGSSYDTSSLYATSLWAMTNASTAVGGTAYNSPASAIALRSNTEIDNNATSSLVGTLRLFEPASTAKYKFVIGEMVFVTGGITMIKTTFAGTYKSTTAVNAFQFLFSSGNIAVGTIRVYGIAK